MPIPPSSTPQPASHLGQMSRERALRDVAWVAEFLNVSKSWVYQATSSGTLPCVRVGAAVRFDPVLLRAKGLADRLALAPALLVSPAVIGLCWLYQYSLLDR